MDKISSKIDTMVNKITNPHGLKGELHVRILEGKNVKELDAFAKSDPFVEFWLDWGCRQKTESRFNTASPVWLAEHRFKITGYEGFLHLRLVDKDVLVDEKNFYLDTWVNVQKRWDTKSQGQVHVVLEFFPDE
ncbi:hypothetical protein G9A89_009211 [Geosiphon pyriformis]|nr:hypothetical protein G9A89_009211 [Geosiphon pyriformis]